MSLHCQVSPSLLSKRRSDWDRNEKSGRMVSAAWPAPKPDSDAAALEGVPPTGSHAQQPYEVLQSASLICRLDASRGIVENVVIAAPSMLPMRVYRPTACGRPHSDNWCT